MLVRFTTLGEQIIAVGGNEEAARLSGVDVDRVKIVVYAISGVLSSIAGMILVARIGAAEPIGGNGFELQAIGASAFGTRGEVLGDDGQRRSFMCVMFDPDTSVVPVAAFLLTRPVPLLQT